jgi:hypothetical protein
MAQESVLFVHVREADIVILERIFAKFTENGWIIPNWVTSLREALEKNDESR